MSKQKKTEPPAHSLAEIASEKATALKEGFIEGKNKLIAVAEEKFESAKKAIHEMTAPTPKAAPKKKAVKKTVKKPPKKAAKKK